MLTGQVDGGWAPPANAYAQLKSSGAGEVYYGVNTVVTSEIVGDTSGPLGDKRVRQALLMAIDREGIVKTAEQGFAEVAESLVSRTTWSGIPGADVDAINAELPKYEYDVAAAKALAEEAGVAGEEMVIETTPAAQSADVIAAAIAQAAKDIGLKPKIKSISPDNYGALFVDPAAREGVDLFMTSWYTSLADPMEFYGMLRTGQFSNYGAWSNTEFDAAAEDALTLQLDDPARIDSIIEADQIATEDLPWLPLYSAPMSVWLGNTISGVQPSIAFLYYPWAADDRGQVMELHHLSATRARELFRSRELSPVELLDAVVERSQKVEPMVNAICEELHDEAYRAAREAERRYLGNGPEPRALEGIPLALKEEQPIAGRTLEEGSLLERGRIAEVSHPVVDRVQAAGAVVHARTTTPEFSCAPFTHSRLWGVTRNPWNLDATPGGSSGGAGAALASGQTILATGSDIGGSIRIPSSFCGVVGFKPPFGRVPGLPPFNSDSYCADGPLGRSVADVAMLQNVLAGPHPGDQASLRPGYRLAESAPPVAGMRVALCLNLGDFQIDPAVEANTRTAAEALRRAGVQVDEVTLPWRRQDLLETAWSHFAAIMGSAINDVVGEHADLVMPYTRYMVQLTADAAPYAEGLSREAELYRPLGDLFESYDALLCPTIGTTAIPAEADVEMAVSVGEEKVAILDAILTLPFNIVGRVPVLAVPSGVAPNGVPTGVQLVGRTYDDQTVFTLGAALEDELGLWTDPGWWPSL